jgi:hypothetical protein
MAFGSARPSIVCASFGRPQHLPRQTLWLRKPGWTRPRSDSAVCAWCPATPPLRLASAHE